MTKRVPTRSKKFFLYFVDLVASYQNIYHMMGLALIFLKLYAFESSFFRFFDLKYFPQAIPNPCQTIYQSIELNEIYQQVKGFYFLSTKKSIFAQKTKKGNFEALYLPKYKALTHDAIHILKARIEFYNISKKKICHSRHIFSKRGVPVKERARSGSSRDLNIRVAAHRLPQEKYNRNQITISDRPL